MPREFLYEPLTIDFLPEVAEKIAVMLSMGYETLDIWNCPGAPNEFQALAYLQDYVKIESLHPRQVKTLNSWMLGATIRQGKLDEPITP
jgi:hypothetical protein